MWKYKTQKNTSNQFKICYLLVIPLFLLLLVLEFISAWNI